MTMSRTLQRAIAFVVHNWPLKLAAIAVATLLYAWLVVAQDSNVYPGPIPITAINQPPDTVVTNQLRDVEQVRYIAPADLGRLRAEDFRATVDLNGLKPDGDPVNVRVNVVAVDPSVTIIDVQPRTIQVTLDQSISKQVPVRVERGIAPPGVSVGETTYTPQQVSVTGPSTLVNRVVAARVAVTLDPGGLDVDREIEADPIDANGEIVLGVDVEPQTVRVVIPLFTNKESRTLPVNPIITGTPAPGFRIASIQVDPLTVLVEGDGEQLTALTQADTAPVPVFGATDDVTQTVAFSLPTGVAATGSGMVTVTVHVVAVLETRTYVAGLRLDGRVPDLDYSVVPDRLLLTLFGSVADLNRLGSVEMVVGVNVAGLDPGTHAVPVVPLLPSGVKLAALSPETVEVTITVPATPTPPPASPTPGASPEASPSLAP